MSAGIHPNAEGHMGDAWFRFYGRLNDFLPMDRRGCRFRHAVRGRPSVKDVIEGLGVPHPEVDLVVVNGTPEDFSIRVDTGDHVSVYPAFRSIDLAGVRRAGADPPHPARFVLDVHLGKLAAFLRLAGFDALLLEQDAEVADVAARDRRIALTRDVGLLKRSVVRHGYWVRNVEPEWQLAEVLTQFDLVASMEPFARCTRCNARVVPVNADSIADRLLPRTRAGFREFHRCPVCDRVYWQGSHYERLGRLLERTRDRASAQRCE